MPTLLVVEEEELVRRMLTHVLTLSGFQVVAVADGIEALAAYQLQSRAIGAVLMDVNMPGLSGPQVLARFQQINPDVCCCFMTGDTSAERTAELIGLGALRVFPKPFISLAELIRFLRECCAGAGSEAADCRTTEEGQ